MSALGQNSRLYPASSAAGYIVGALYNRQRDIHDRFGGQWQSGIVTPRQAPLIIVFTSAAGHQHGYYDYWDENGIFHYFGAGQEGDMEFVRGNSALRDHIKDGKQLLVFQALGGGIHRFQGEFVCLGYDIVPNHPDKNGNLRNAILFRLRPVHDDVGEELVPTTLPFVDLENVGATTQQILTTIRTKQDLFRRRLTTIERGCRLTNVYDLRFLRASHIKPWAASDDSERVDRNNGLLLTPSADLLFDHGWISFEQNGRLIVAEGMPGPVTEKIGLDLTPGRDCGEFTAEQRGFLEYHRDCVFEQREFQGRLVYELFD